MNRRSEQPVPTARLDGRGSFVIPAKVRRALGLVPGTLLIVEAHEGAVVVRPAVAVPVASLGRGVPSRDDDVRDGAVPAKDGGSDVAGRLTVRKADSDAEAFSSSPVRGDRTRQAV